MNTATEFGELSAALLLDAPLIDDPYPFYRRLVAEAPVWRVPGTEIVVVSSYGAVTEVVSRVDDFSSNLRSMIYRGTGGLPERIPFPAGELQTLAIADPPVHTLHRRAVFSELVARRMAALRPDIEALAEAHLAATLPSGRLEVMGELANPIPMRVVSRLIGFAGADQAQLLAAAFDSTAMLAATCPLESLYASMERSGEVVAWIGEQLQGAIDGGGDGILAALGAAVAAGDLGFTEGLVILHTLLSAGGESTTSLLGSAIHMLAQDAALQTRLRDDPSLIAPFIEEALRLESPFRHHMRHATRSTDLRGVVIPTESTLLLFWGAANRDPAEYDRPDDVVLDRPLPKHHLAFGRGIHFCVGAPLARLEAEIVLGRLLARTERFAPDPQRPPARVNSLMVRRFSALPLVVHARPSGT